MSRTLTLLGICFLLCNLLASYGYTATPSAIVTPIRIRGDTPTDVVITPDGSRVYVAAISTHNVFVIDMKTNLITNVIDLWEDGFYGVWPFRLAITPDGATIYVANIVSNNISVIDTNTNRVVAKIGMGYPVHDVVFTLDGRFAYVELGWDRVAVIDVGKNKVIKTILLDKDGQTFTIAVSHDGQKVYVVSQVWAGGARVYVIDVATNQVIDRFEVSKEVTNQGMIAISPDDSKLYLSCGITYASYQRPTEGVNKVFVVDLSTKSVTAEIPIIGGPISMRLSSDGRLGYVSTFAAKKIFVVDLTNNTVAGEIKWGKILAGEEWRKTDLRDMVIYREGGRLYITGWDADAVLVANLTTNRMIDIIELNKVNIYLYEIAITPDGRQIYVTGQDARGTGGKLFVIDTATDSILQKIAFDSFPRNPCITPDGRHLYVVSGNQVLEMEVATNMIVRRISLGMLGSFSMT